MVTKIRESVLTQMEEKIAAGERLSDATAQARRAALTSGWAEAELKKLASVAP